MDHSDNYNNYRQQENLGLCAAEGLLAEQTPAAWLNVPLLRGHNQTRAIRLN